MSVWMAPILLVILAVLWLGWEFYHAPVLDDDPVVRSRDDFAWGVWIGMDTDTPHERRHGGLS